MAGGVFKIPKRVNSCQFVSLRSLFLNFFPLCQNSLKSRHWLPAIVSPGFLGRAGVAQSWGNERPDVFVFCICFGMGSIYIYNI